MTNCSVLQAIAFDNDRNPILIPFSSLQATIDLERAELVLSMDLSDGAPFVFRRHKLSGDGDYLACLEIVSEREEINYASTLGKLAVTAVATALIAKGTHHLVREHDKTLVEGSTGLYEDKDANTSMGVGSVGAGSALLHLGRSGPDMRTLITARLLVADGTRVSFEMEEEDIATLMEFDNVIWGDEAQESFRGHFESISSRLADGERSISELDLEIEELQKKESDLGTQLNDGATFEERDATRKSLAQIGQQRRDKVELKMTLVYLLAYEKAKKSRKFDLFDQLKEESSRRASAASNRAKERRERWMWNGFICFLVWMSLLLPSPWSFLIALIVGVAGFVVLPNWAKDRLERAALDATEPTNIPKEGSQSTAEPTPIAPEVTQLKTEPLQITEEVTHLKTDPQLIAAEVSHSKIEPLPITEEVTHLKTEPPPIAAEVAHLKTELPPRVIESPLGSPSSSSPVVAAPVASGKAGWMPVFGVVGVVTIGIGLTILFIRDPNVSSLGTSGPSGDSRSSNIVVPTNPAPTTSPGEVGKSPEIAVDALPQDSTKNNVVPTLSAKTQGAKPSSTDLSLSTPQPTETDERRLLKQSEDGRIPTNKRESEQRTASIGVLDKSDPSDGQHRAIQVDSGSSPSQVTISSATTGKAADPKFQSLIASLSRLQNGTDITFGDVFRVLLPSAESGIKEKLEQYGNFMHRMAYRSSVAWSIESDGHIARGHSWGFRDQDSADDRAILECQKNQIMKDPRAKCQVFYRSRTFDVLVLSGLVEAARGPDFGNWEKGALRSFDSIGK